MPDAIPALTVLPAPSFVMTSEGYRLATYTWGEPDAPAVIAVHGFASSTGDNWVATGWIRDLTRAGYRVIALDQLGHGASEKPHEASDYTITALADDVQLVMDTYMVDEAVYVGYSLGARVGWQVAQNLVRRITRVVLGGVPDGVPLSRLDLPQVRAYVDHGTPVSDPTTQNYIRLTERVGGNDLGALLALAEGLRTTGAVDPDPQHAPQQPVLFATGSEDGIIAGSRALAAETPQGTFVEIPARNHFNAPGSRHFRAAALAFLRGEELPAFD